jgi:hypothetical protein
MPMPIEELLARRTDLSTFLVHLTKDGGGQTAKQKLISMITSARIEARSPFGPAVPRLTAAGQPTDSQRCVCFTETPLEHVHILTSEIADRAFHFLPYGVAISKKQGRRAGVNPVWYMDITPGHPWLTQPLEQMIDAAIAAGPFADNPLARLTPYIEQMGTGPLAAGAGGYKKEFWWEREWRHQGDYSLAGRPIILCPAADIAEVRAALNAVPEHQRMIDDPSFVDPRWSLEQIIGKLAGFVMGDLGAF